MPQRTRTKTETSGATRYQWTCYWYDSLGGAIGTNTINPTDRPYTKTSTITDETGRRPKRGFVRACTHTVTVTRLVNLSLEGEFPMNPTNFDTRGRVRGYVQLKGLNWGASFIPPNVTLPSTLAWRSSAFKSLSEQIPSTVSLANFLLELDDLPRMISNIFALQARGLSSIRQIRGLSSRPRSTRSGSKDFRRNRPGKVANQDHLEVNFAIGPFIRDLISLTQSLDTYKRRVAWLKKTRGKPVPVKRRRVDSAEGPWTSWSNWSYFTVGWGGDIRFRHRSRETKTQTTVVGATLVHDLKGLDDFSRLATGYLDALGFNKPLAIVWEALPFSWLVDYFVRIGDVLEQVRTADPFQGDMLLRDSWTSVKTVTKVEAEVEYYFSCYSSRVPTDGNKTVRAIVKETSTYVRSKGVDTSVGLVATSDLTLNQYLNLAALLT